MDKMEQANPNKMERANMNRMGLDVSGFITPEQSFKGLDQVSEMLEMKRHGHEQDHLKEDETKRQEQNKRDASSSFFANYFDDKALFTGTKFDPMNWGLIENGKKQAFDLINKGADRASIFLTLAPLINKIGRYSDNAQKYSALKKGVLDNLKTQKGWNLDRVSRAIDEVTFFNEDGTPRNIDEVDPDKIGDYVQLALRTKQGLADPLGNIGELLRKNDLIHTKATVQKTNAKGGSKLEIGDVSMYDWMQTDNEGEFVPKFEHALDGDEYIKFKFSKKDKEGKVRMLDEKVFDNLIKDDPSYHQALMEQVKSAGYSDDFKNDLASKNAARALAYTDATNYVKGYVAPTLRQKDDPIYRPGITIINQQNKLASASKLIDSYPTLPNGNKDLSTSLNNRYNKEGKNIKEITSVEFNPKDKTISINGGKFEPIKQARFRIEGTNPDAKLDIFDEMERYKHSGKIETKPTGSWKDRAKKVN